MLVRIPVPRVIKWRFPRRYELVPPRITIGPWAKGYCRVLRGGGVLMSEIPL